MRNINAILVPLDGSPVAESSLPAAVNVARRLNALVHLVRVHPQFPLGEFEADILALGPDTERKVVEQEAGYLEGVATQLRGDGVAVTTEVVKGEIVPALRSYIERHDVGLVVMASHGRGGLTRAVLGSVADTLIRSVSIPVLLVNPRTVARVNTAWPSRILVPLDGSVLGASAMELLPLLDPDRNAKVLLTSVVQTIPPSINPWVFPPEFFSDTVEQRDEQSRHYLARTVWDLRCQGFHAGVRIGVGSKVAAEILKLAIWKRCDLIVMSTHGAGGLDRVMFGSVADQVLRHANIPVLVVHPVEKAEPTVESAPACELARTGA
jgi:nucleotide-binding universal stress UspA family protein